MTLKRSAVDDRENPYPSELANCLAKQTGSQFHLIRKGCLDNCAELSMTPEDLIKLNETDLLAALGEELTKSHAHAFPLRPDQLVQLAVDWLKNNHQFLCSLLCANSKLHELCRHGAKIEDTLIVVHVLSLLAHRLEVDATLVAVILVRRGLHSLCSSVWNK